MADPAIMERVIANLIGNALRYAPAASPPLVTATARGGRVELRVIDHGPGIPKADRERVFLPFQRRGAPSHRTGVGLGLVVSRGLAEAMGGTVEPEETPGGGLTMVISHARGARPASRRGCGFAEDGPRESSGIMACPRTTACLDTKASPSPPASSWPIADRTGPRQAACSL